MPAPRARCRACPCRVCNKTLAAPFLHVHAFSLSPAACCVCPWLKPKRFFPPSFSPIDSARLQPPPLCICHGLPSVLSPSSAPIFALAPAPTTDCADLFGHAVLLPAIFPQLIRSPSLAASPAPCRSCPPCAAWFTSASVTTAATEQTSRDEQKLHKGQQNAQRITNQKSQYKVKNLWIKSGSC